MEPDRIQHVVAVAHRGGHTVHLRFDDGVEGDVDLEPIIAPFTGILAPLADPAFVAQVQVNDDFGTLCWPNGVDLDPVVLYCAVKGIPLPTFAEAKTAPRRRHTRDVARRTARPAESRRRKES